MGPPAGAALAKLVASGQATKVEQAVEALTSADGLLVAPGEPALLAIANLLRSAPPPSSSSSSSSAAAAATKGADAERMAIALEAKLNQFAAKAVEDGDADLLRKLHAAGAAIFLKSVPPANAVGVRASGSTHVLAVAAEKGAQAVVEFLFERLPTEAALWATVPVATPQGRKLPVTIAREKKLPAVEKLLLKPVMDKLRVLLLSGEDGVLSEALFYLRQLPKDGINDVATEGTGNTLLHAAVLGASETLVR